MKKISLYVTLALTALLMGACSGDYTNWADPQAYSQENAVTIPGFKATAVASQDLATTKFRQKFYRTAIYSYRLLLLVNICFNKTTYMRISD